MKNIHTPISSSIGNHETKIFMRSEGSSSGFASMITPFLSRSLTSHGSDGEYVVKRSPLRFTPLSTLPSIVTFATLPCFTSSMNWEYSIAFCPAWRVLNWLKTVISTSAITSQIATFLIRLFKQAPQWRHSALNVSILDSFATQAKHRSRRRHGSRQGCCQELRPPRLERGGNQP